VIEEYDIVYVLYRLTDEETEIVEGPSWTDSVQILGDTVRPVRHSSLGLARLEVTSNSKSSVSNSDSLTSSDRARRTRGHDQRLSAPTDPASTEYWVQLRTNVPNPPCERTPPARVHLPKSDSPSVKPRAGVDLVVYFLHHRAKSVTPILLISVWTEDPINRNRIRKREEIPRDVVAV
jgi:hypothetical protein